MVITQSACTYIKQICEKIEPLMDWKLKKFGSPLESEYHPKMDISGLLSADDTSKYCMMVGSLNWVVTLGQFDVHYATQTMARYSMVPRVGHLEAMKRIFGYLKHHAKMQTVYNTALPDHMDYEAVTYDWFEHYGPSHKELPPDMPIPKGNPVRLTAFFDADHAGCLSTQRLTTGALVFLNNTPVKLYSKRQSTVESSTYGSEMVAGRITVKMAIKMRYKL